MPELIPCRTCRQMVSSAAARCPACGDMWPQTLRCRQCDEFNSMLATTCAKCGAQRPGVSQAALDNEARTMKQTKYGCFIFSRHHGRDHLGIDRFVIAP